jgi:hypothetical protein
MRAHKIVCIAALVILAVGLLAVALDDFILPGVDHRPSNCPICSWANSLASSVLPALVLPIEVTGCSWPPLEPPSVFADEPFCALFSARAPPALAAI